jgi:hypothetical protein
MTIGLGRDGHGVLRLVRPGVYLHWCPGCKTGHTFNISSTDHPEGRRWGFDGDLARPSVEPELSFPGCTYLLRGGLIRYADDCSHALAGKVVPLPDYPR